MMPYLACEYVCRSELLRHCEPNPGGLFAQWLPLYQLDKRNLQTILRTFLEVFPGSHSFLGLYNTDTPPLLLLGRVPGGEPADNQRRITVLLPLINTRCSMCSFTARARRCGACSGIMSATEIARDELQRVSREP